MSSIADAIRELRRHVDEATAADWRHPAWWTLVVGTALLERMAPPGGDDLYAAYLGANGGPRSDTFMARPANGAADRHALAVGRAAAAWRAIDALDGTLPAQPLRVHLGREGGWLRVRPLAGRGTVFLLDDGAWLADGEITAAALAERRGLVRVDPGAQEPTPAAVAVSMREHPIAIARHLHRGGWTRAGGPWLGIGDADGWQVVTTCHLAVDGYGHAQLSDRILTPHPDPPPAARGEGVDTPSEPRQPPPLPATSSGDGGASQVPPPPARRGEGQGGGHDTSAPVGFAAEVIPAVTFTDAAFAFARVLAEQHGWTRGRSPTFQIPFAPGRRDDPDRLRRRVLFTLASLGQGEPRDAFAERLRAQLQREAEHPGLLTRVLGATARAPLPDGLRLRLLGASRAPSRWLPPTEALPGRGSLAFLRFPESERPRGPLAAVSSPPIWDAEGSISFTLIDHGDRATASVAGTGRAGSHAGARAFLDAWCREVNRSRGW